jgi:hypothetical protein
VWRCQSEDSAVVADTVLAAIVESEADAVKIDSVGIGWGVAGHLNRMKREGKHSATIIKVNVGAASSRPDRFPRLRDEIWWEIGHNLTEQGGWDLAEIDDKTAADLTEPKWKPDPRGRVQVEPKVDTKKRLGRSPDDADALLLAFYAGGVGGTWLAALSQMADSGTEPEAGREAPTSVPNGLHACKNPVCERLVSLASLYCCGGCAQAHEGKYEIHESGPLAHGAECDGRHASRSEGPVLLPAPSSEPLGLGRLDQLQRRR